MERMGKAIRRYWRQEAEKKIRREEWHFRAQHTPIRSE